MLKNLTISRRLTWLNTLVSASALLLACLAFLTYDQVTFKRTLVRNLSAEAQVVGLNSISALVFNDPDSANATLSALQSSPSVLAASIFTSDGRLFASYALDSRYAIHNVHDIPRGSDEAYTFSGNQVLLSRTIMFGNKPMGTIAIRGSLAELSSHLRQYLGIVLVVLVVSLAAALLISAAFRRAVAEPIVNLAQTARSISRDKNYTIRATPTGNRDETAILIDAFNEMLERIHDRDAALETERARLTAIVDNAPVGIVLAEAPSGNIIIFNRRAQDIVGHDLLPSPTIDAYQQWSTLHADGHELATHEHPLARTIQHGEVVQGEEYRYRRPDGRETWIRSSSAPVRDKQGRIVAGVLAFFDVDEQKRAEEALLRSEKLAAAGRLAASISHEINNPLESITNLLYLALTDKALTPMTRDFLTQAEQELTRVSQITTQTLRFYRQTTNPTSADISALLESVFRLLKGRLAHTQVEVVKQYRARNEIICFEGELRQVFTNLIGNALDAMAGKPGQLLVRTSETINRATGEAGVRVTIADHGSGISPEIVERIFEPFYSTKGNRGTGLGLWVSKEIINKHRGTIRVKSTVGVGTTFSVFLPQNCLKQDQGNMPNSASA